MACKKSEEPPPLSNPWQEVEKGQILRENKNSLFPFFQSTTSRDQKQLTSCFLFEM